VDGTIGGNVTTTTPSMTFADNQPPSFAALNTGNTGIGGTPAGAWIPNVASPDDESTNYADLPDSPYVPDASDANDGYGVGEGGTLSPDTASKIQKDGDTPSSPTSTTDTTNASHYTLGEWLQST